MNDSHQNTRPVIGEFSDSYPPVMDGVSVVVHTYARWMHAHGADVSVVTPRVPGARYQDNVRVLRYASLPAPGHRPYRLGVPGLDPRLHAKLQRIPFQLVHAHCPFSSGKLALRLARSRGIPIVATMHSRYDIDVRNAIHVERIVNWYVKRLVRFYESVDEVWVPNEATRGTMRSYGYDGRIVVQPNGTDLDPPSDRELGELRRRARHELGVRGGEPVALYVGQQSLKKRLDLLVRAVAAVARGKRPSLRLVLVGTGPDMGGLASLATEEGIASRVIFTGEVRERAKMRSLYAAADLFAFPSDYDTDGIVLKEAAAFSLPSVVLAGSSPASMVEDGVNGLTCAATVESLAASILTLLADRRLRRRLGEAALASLYKPIDDVARTAYERYLAILERRGSGR
jgi:1,2-diacylglycerol 3-alpha-glucosyltransferase